MHAVILGAGRVGVRLARQLIDEKRDVAIIEKDPETARRIGRLLDCLVINAGGTSLTTLEQAGIRKADYFVAVTDSDEVNMIAGECPEHSGYHISAEDVVVEIVDDEPGTWSYSSTGAVCES